MARLALGIFGGTFDPIHIGHLILAAEAQYQLELDRVLWVLTPAPPHKLPNGITSLEGRLEMLQAAIAGNPFFELSRIDIDRPPPHYAADTVRLLHRQYPDAELTYLMGGDSLHDLPTWYHPQEFLGGVHFLGVMHRPGIQLDLCKLETKLPGIHAKIRFLKSPLVEISATEIRRRIARKEPFRYFLPDPVYQLITQRDYYQRT